jgi:hypothetical protein
VSPPPSLQNEREQGRERVKGKDREVKREWSRANKDFKNNGAYGGCRVTVIDIMVLTKWDEEANGERRKRNRPRALSFQKGSLTHGDTDTMSTPSPGSISAEGKTPARTPLSLASVAETDTPHGLQAALSLINRGSARFWLEIEDEGQGSRALPRCSQVLFE